MLSLRDAIRASSYLIYATGLLCDASDVTGALARFDFNFRLIFDFSLVVQDGKGLA